MNHDRYHDSAGVPWAGRSFEGNSWSGDDGSCPAPLAELLVAESLDQVAFLNALRDQRLLIPLVAQLGEGEVGPNGLMVEKSADLAIVAVKTPDGKSAIPAFTSVAQMQAWKPEARPVPVDARKIALACASEGHERLVIDPAGVAVVIRRPALAALAQGLKWQKPELNPEVVAHVKALGAGFSEVFSVDLFDGDPTNDLSHAELQIQLGLRPGLSPDGLKAFLHKFTEELQTPDFNTQVDSITLKLVMV
jgi:hypothetical protein